MSYTAHPTVVTGQTWTAANQNTYVKDNFAALWVYTTAGDICYATSASAANRLGIGSTALLGLRTNAGKTAPEWGYAKGSVNAIGFASWSTEVVTASTHTAWVDLASVNVTTTETCTIVMSGCAFFAITDDGYQAHITGSIGGTQDTNYNACSAATATSINGHAGGYAWRRTGVTAGTIACKMQMRSSNASIQATSERGQFTILAVVE